MAKKGNRNLFIFQCSVCRNRNYTAIKNAINSKEKLTLNKFCSHCRKTTLHNETKL